MLLHPRRKVKTGVLSFFSQMSLVLLRSILVQVSFSQPAFGGAGRWVLAEWCLSAAGGGGGVRELS